MSRRKKQNRPETIAGGYSAIPWAVLDSISFIGASDKAKALLFAIMRQHNGSNNGHLHLAQSWIAKRGYACPASNIKSRNELLDRGLLMQTKWGGLNMGANLFALTWLAIDNFIGLDISAKNYQRGAYALCNLLPTQRRKQPIKKQIEHFSQCNSAVSPSVTGGFAALSHSETEKALSNALTVSVSENNVFIPLPLPNSIERIVGVKGKSGIAKLQTVATN